MVNVEVFNNLKFVIILIIIQKYPGNSKNIFLTCFNCTGHSTFIQNVTLLSASSLLHSTETV